MLTLEKVKKGIYEVGCYPALVFLRGQQDIENFNDCKIIKEALDDVINSREWYLSSKVDDRSLKETYDKILGSKEDSSNLESNMPYYIKKFRQMMESEE